MTEELYLPKAYITNDEQQTILRSFNEKEREAYNNICQKFQSLMKNELHGRYELAFYIHKIYVETKTKTGGYGERFFERLAIALGLKSTTPLNEMVKIVERWPSWDELEVEFKALQIQPRWKDLVYLSKSRDESEYQALIADIRDGRSTAEIARKSKKSQDEIEGRGRKPKTFDTIDSVLSDVCAQASLINKKCLLSWSNFEYSKTIDKLLDSGNIELLSPIVKKLISATKILETAISTLDNYLATIDSLKSTILQKCPTLAQAWNEDEDSQEEDDNENEIDEQSKILDLPQE